MNRIYCDNCGCEITAEECGRIAYAKKTFSFVEKTSVPGIRTYTMDLCDKCVDGVLKNLNELKTNRGISKEPGDTLKGKKG